MDRILSELKRIERELTELANDLHFDRDPETRELVRAADASVSSAVRRRRVMVAVRDEEDAEEAALERDHVAELALEAGRQP